MIYLDHNATTPIAAEVADAMRPFLEGGFGNPSSAHRLGREAHAAVEAARSQVAAFLGCGADELIFTSGGTESNNHALWGVVRARRDRGDHIITSAVEHPAILEVCHALVEREGVRLTVLPVDREGRVRPEDLEAALDDRTLLVSVMHANNEVGTLQPIADLARLAHAAGALFHTDAAQSLGKIPAQVDDLGVDLLSVAGHKLYAPKGIGALFIRRGVEVTPLLQGAGHERGQRPGTENVLHIVGLGKACEIAGEALAAGEEARLVTLRERLHTGLLSALGADTVVLNGHTTARLPNTLSVGLVGARADALLGVLDGEVAASAGAACHADGAESISSVLQAMDVPADVARGTLRLSLGRHTTAEEVDRAVEVIVAAVSQKFKTAPA